MCSYLVQDCLDANKKTIYELISSHGAVDDVVFFAMLMKGWSSLQQNDCTL